MMTRRFLSTIFCLCFLCSMTMRAYAESYDGLWKQVEKYEQKDLPRSAYKVVEQIAAKARKEQVKGQQLAALLYGCVLRQQIVPDSFYTDMLMLERYKRETDDEVLRAVYASVLGELYANNARRNRNYGSSMSAHPDSLREWSYKQFMAASSENYRLSMARPESLSEVKAADFLPFIERGKDAGYYNGDLLNVIGRRATENFSRDEEDYVGQLAEWYAAMLEVYREKGNREAELLLMLDSVAHSRKPESPIGYNLREKQQDEEQERKTLQSSTYKAYASMLERFGDLPLATEIYIQMMDLDVTVALKIKWVDEACRSYPAYPRSNILRNRKAEWQNPEMSLDFPRLCYPDKVVWQKVAHRHLNGVELQWYRMPENVMPQDFDKLGRDKMKAKALKEGKQVKKQRFEWPSAEPYEKVSDTMAMEVPGIGYYVVIMRPDGVTSSKQEMVGHVSVSRFKVLTQGLPGNRVQCRVVDAMSGNPVPFATVTAYRREVKYAEKQTDATGTAIIALHEEKDYYSRCLNYTAAKDEDKYMPCETMCANYSYVEDERTQNHVRLFTDRAVYRLGQTVYVGGLCSNRKGREESVDGNRNLLLELYDANRKKIAERDVEVDEMGKFSADFVLPSFGLSGSYYVRTSNGSVYFKVEEYKRPTFEVKLHPLSDVFHAGDTVMLRGEVMNYTGVPVRQARITASTVLKSWFMRRGNADESLPLDTVYSDEKGAFVLPVPIRDGGDNLHVPGLRQLVQVAAMSAAGETHEAELSIPLNSAGLSIHLDAPVFWEKSSSSTLQVSLRTIAGAEVKDSATVRYDLYRLKPDAPRETVWKDRVWSPDKAVKSDFFDGLPFGRYEISFCATTERDTAKAVHSFILFDKNASRPVDNIKDWMYVARDTVSEDMPGHVQIGSGAKDVTLYYTLFCKNKVLKDTLYEFTDSVLNFTYPYDASYGDGLSASFVFVKEDTVYHHVCLLPLRQPEKELKFQWTSFRDRLQPGDTETWKLRVLTPDGKPAPAQLMTSMYDASLEQIAPHKWYLQRYKYLSYPSAGFNYTDANRWNSFMGYSAPWKYLSYKNFSFDHVDWKMLRWGLVTVEECLMIADHAAEVTAYGTAGVAMKEEPLMSQQKTMKLRSASAMPSATNGYDEAEAEEADEADAGGGKESMAVHVRENLNETAFFYPCLTPDENGDFTITFTLPESLTSWRFMALAHTKDMMSGIFTDEVVAAKEVMAQLNLPRFVRVGDRATLSATLYNLTEKALKGRVVMELLNPETGKSLWKESQKMKLDASSDTVVMFSYMVKEGVSLPVCRVMFEADGHSDGEQRYLPILENKEWLTQTKPFYVQGKGQTEIKLDGLFQDNHPDATHRRLTIEYTANPIWYAVQALPSVLEPRTDDALSLGAALYASVLSSRLVASYPRLKSVSDLWMQQAPEKVKSPLAEDEELKGILLDETPWVADADAETRRMQGLRQLFDTNRQADLQNRFSESLGRLQHTDGSFGWFRGMSGSPYITLNLAGLLGRGGMLTSGNVPAVVGQHVDLKNMVKYLMSRFHDEVVKDKKSLKENKSELYSGSYWLPYLYVAGLCDKGWLDASACADIVYGESRLIKDMHGLNADDKACAATVLWRTGRKDEALQLIRSLREHLVEASDGIHLEYPFNGFYSSEHKINTHVALMEAFEMAGSTDEELMNGLCRWLLGQKQVQAWGTVTGSMNAVYALVGMQGKELDVQSHDEVRMVSPKGEVLASLDSSEGELAGLGCVKASVSGKGLSRGAGMLVVDKTEDKPTAWGAAYAQYQLPLAEVESAAAGLRIRCEVSSASPKVGDRLTLRYVITADKDYEYVCFKAGRAACLEPVGAHNGFEFRNGLGYYKEVRDASTNYFFERLPKGTYVVEEEHYVERAGTYMLGVAKLNGVYAPEFSAYGNAPVLEVRP